MQAKSIPLLALFASLALLGEPQAATTEAPKPHIVADRISYGDTRKDQMAAYSDRHYGKREWRLRRHDAIVLHFTDTDDYPPVWTSLRMPPARGARVPRAAAAPLAAETAIRHPGDVG